MQIADLREQVQFETRLTTHDVSEDEGSFESIDLSQLDYQESMQGRKDEIKILVKRLEECTLLSLKTF